jgi:hypothetical protein
VSNTDKRSLLIELGLATARDGFFAGAVVAAILQLGIIKIVIPQQGFAIAVLLILAAYLTYYHAVKHQSFISPPLDGSVIGFGWIFGLLSLVGIYPH